MTSPRSRGSFAGRQPVSSTPSAPHSGGADDAGLVPGQDKAARSPGGRARRRLAPGVAGAALLLAVTTGCTSNALTRLGMPVPVTKQGQATLTLWQGSWAAPRGGPRRRAHPGHVPG